MLHLGSSTAASRNERFILDITPDVPLETALEGVLLSIKQGRISTTRGQKHHCHHIAMSLTNGEKLHVSCFLNKKSERFLIYKDKQ